MPFRNKIKNETVKQKYTKSDLIKPDYLISEEKNLKIYYAPVDYLNTNASIIIVGITPGWTQMEISYRTVIKSFIDSNDWTESLLSGKKAASFAGSMRTNLINMLDELHLNKKLGINSTEELFNNKNSILHTTSILKYPVFIDNKNYNGKKPSPIKTKLLWDAIKQNFVPEINSFENKLIIPLGNSVSDVLKKLQEEKLIKKNIVLNYFPHPSGANGHRKKQFLEYKSIMKKQIDNWNYK
ncbi:MAG: hypothetical protein H0U95_16995 [Bacteroidetes bacterium]|nr:hypothetical protein [Bacteroidota bacterium]